MRTGLQRRAASGTNASASVEMPSGAHTHPDVLLANLPLRSGHRAMGHPMVDMALAAGRDALHSAGIGWYPNSDVAASAHPGQPIHLELLGFKRIELRVNPDMLAHRATALQGAVSVDNPLTIVWNAVRSLVRLFAGYYDACPRDLWGHRRLVEAASWGAYRTYYPTESESRISSSIASFFERAIVTYALTRSEGTDFVSGLAMERSINQHPPHLLSAMLERSQAVLFPTEWENAFRISPVTPDPTADALLEEVLFSLFRVHFRTVRGKLRLRGRIRCPVSWEWARRVEELAELLAPYIEQPADSTSPQANPFHPRGLAGDRPPLSEPSGGFPFMDPGDSANPFAVSGNQKQQAPSFYPGGGLLPGTGRGRGISCGFEQLDEHYSRQARSLQVREDNNDEREQEPEMLPVGFLDYAPASLRDLACGQIDWFRTRRSPPSDRNPSGLELHRLIEPLEIPVDPVDPAAWDVPNLLLVVDSSGSMKFNPLANGPARGQYDVVLMACWGLFRYINERGLGDRVWVNAVNFSGATRSSGWHKGSELDPVKRVLAAYEGGGTTLGTSAILKARETTHGRFLTVAMTDGCIGNTPQALEELRRTAEAGNSLALLHIGTPNAFTEGVKQLGGRVHILGDASGLVGLCLDLAKANYNTQTGAK